MLNVYTFDKTTQRDTPDLTGCAAESTCKAFLCQMNHRFLASTGLQTGQHHNFQFGFSFSNLTVGPLCRILFYLFLFTEEVWYNKLPLSIDKTNRLTVLWVSRTNYQEAVNTSLQACENLVRMRSTKIMGLFKV